LWENARSGLTPAEYLLRDFETRWKGDMSRLYEECAY
jgi:gamma-glutamylcysteine synthetase